MEFPLVVSLVIGLVALVIGGEFLVRGATKLAASLGIPSVIIGLTVVAFGTSTPELAVSLKAALNGNADISLANVVGSNIFNVFFILGISALISPLVIHSQMIFREVPVMIGASILLWIFSLNGTIAPWEGFCLFAGIIFYTGWLIFEALQKRKEDKKIREESEKDFPLESGTLSGILKSLGFIVAGLGIVMLGADKLVEGAVALAQALGVSDMVIGITIVAAGTSLPEVVASVVATIKGERDIAIGNVIGSNIYNILAILGITGITSELRVNEAMQNFDIPLNIGISVLCFFVFWRKRKLSRIEGAIFLLLYIGYTYYLIRAVA